MLLVYFWLLCWNDSEVFQAQNNVDKLVLYFCFVLDADDNKVSPALNFLVISCLLKMSSSKLIRCSVWNSYQKLSILFH